VVVDVTRAYYFGSAFNVEMEIVLPGAMSVCESHDIALALQHRIEESDLVERAFVHVSKPSLSVRLSVWLGHLSLWVLPSDHCCVVLIDSSFFCAAICHCCYYNNYHCCHSLLPLRVLACRSIMQSETASSTRLSGTCMREGPAHPPRSWKTPRARAADTS
jgi:hypothetical protein